MLEITQIYGDNWCFASPWCPWKHLGWPDWDLDTPNGQRTPFQNEMQFFLQVFIHYKFQFWRKKQFSSWQIFIQWKFYPSSYWSKTVLAHVDNYPSRDMHKLCLIFSESDSAAQIFVSSHVSAVGTRQYWMTWNMLYDLANVFGPPKRSSFSLYGGSAIQHPFVLDIHCHIINIYERLAP